MLLMSKVSTPPAETEAGPRAEGPVAEGPRAEGPVAEGPRAAGPVAEGPRAAGAARPRPGCYEQTEISE